MERILFKNTLSAKWVVGSFFFGSLALQKIWFKTYLI